MRRRAPTAIVALGAAAALLAAAPAHPTTLFGLVDTGELFVSADQGMSWSIRSTLPVRDAVALAAGATASELYLASRSGDVYRSTDAGFNWTAVGTVPAADVVDLAIRADLSLLLLTASGAVYRSTDQGASFTALAALPAHDHTSLTPTAAGPLYALTRTGAVSESTDGGTIWTAKGTIAASDALRMRAIGTTLYVMTAAGEVYRSTDAAVTWTPVGTLSQVGMTALARDVATLIVSTRAGEVATSADGATWTWKGAINQLTVTGLGVDLPATTGVAPAPTTFGLEVSPPWPNPMRGDETLNLALRLERSEKVRAVIHDLAGRAVAARAATPFPAGPGTVRWRLQGLRPGLYFLTVSSESGHAVVRRLAVIR
jgi:hypothetical protein